MCKFSRKTEFSGSMRGQCKYIVKLPLWGLLALPVFLFNGIVAAQVPGECRQLLVAVAPDWNSHRASMQIYERSAKKTEWQPISSTGWPVLLGRNGLAWGRGAFTPPNDGRPRKSEKDGRAPAGIFALGPVYGYASAPPRGTTWPYFVVGPYDAWIDDPKLPHYNEHVRVDAQKIPEWFESQKMRLGDAAYRWMLEIKHNSNPATPGLGSAIFFHVRRGADRPSAGCTTMAADDLENVIRRLRSDAKPHYVLLPTEAYDRLRGDWKLP